MRWTPYCGHGHIYSVEGWLSGGACGHDDSADNLSEEKRPSD